MPPKNTPQPVSPSAVMIQPPPKFSEDLPDIQAQIDDKAITPGPADNTTNDRLPMEHLHALTMQIKDLRGQLNVLIKATDRFRHAEPAQLQRAFQLVSELIDVQKDRMVIAGAKIANHHYMAVFRQQLCLYLSVQHIYYDAHPALWVLQLLRDMGTHIAVPGNDEWYRSIQTGHHSYQRNYYRFRTELRDRVTAIVQDDSLRRLKNYNEKLGTFLDQIKPGDAPYPNPSRVIGLWNGRIESAWHWSFKRKEDPIRPEPSVEPESKKVINKHVQAAGADGADDDEDGEWLLVEPEDADNKPEIDDDWVLIS